MATSAKLSGETLVVRHIPLAHGQSVGYQLYSSVQRPRRPCSLRLTHSISLPERGEPPKEDFLSQSSKSSSDEAGSTDQGAEDDRGCDSFLTFQFSPSQRWMDLTGSRSTPRWQNPFLPESEVHEDDDDSEGDNLHKYQEGSSFQLHGNLNGIQDTGMEIWACPTSSPASNKMSHQDLDLFGSPKEHKQLKSLSDSGLQQRRDSKGTPILMDCEEQEWGDEEGYDEYTLKERTCERNSDSESSTQKQTEYISDSSCNSSDGVLVNFSAIYNKTNNAVPATPHDLDSPSKHSHRSQEEDFKPVPCWSPCGVDPNCNIYPLDSNGLASLEIADLTACLQSQARLMTSTQNYYKLVTCDLSSQSSPSPAWSSVTSCSETHSQGSLTPPTEYFLFRRPEGQEGDAHKLNQSDLQVDEDIKRKRSKRTSKDSSKCTTHNSKSRCQKPKTHQQGGCIQSQSWYGKQGCLSSPKQKALPRVPSCPGQINLELFSHVPKQHITSFAELARGKKGGGDSSSMENSMEVPTCSKFTHSTSPVQRKTPLGQSRTLITIQSAKTSESSEICETPSTSEGACASSPEVVRYTKAQRPTFLPIQPFVLQPPPGKQPSKSLGSLLNQYISHKHGKPSTSKSTGKCKGLASHLRPSPLGSLEVATSSDTCSTCTPSPVQPHIQPHWAQPSSLLVQNHLQPVLKQDSPNMLDIEASVKSPRAAKQSQTGQQVPSIKLFLNMEPLEQPNPERPSSVMNEELLFPKARTQEQCDPTNHSSSPAITSVTFLSSDASFKCASSAGQRFKELSEVELSTSASFGPRKPPCFLIKEPRQHSNSFSLTDRPPEEFCLSPDASNELMSIDLLQKRDMLKSISVAVDLITAHFSSSRDPEEKIRLGNSSLCLSISQLVLGQLCPAIRSVLQDGLKAFRLDLIVGQRRNRPWSVVEACTRPGPSTRLLHSLVSVVRKCSQLTNHSMRLNAFILGLLNLRALESWFRHLHTCIDTIAEYYHHYAFLALSQGPACQSLFQELLLLLQPLNQLPFDLHLLSEPRLQKKLAQKPSRSPGCPFLEIPSQHQNDGAPERPKLKDGDLQLENCGENFQSCAVKFCKTSPEEKSISLTSPEGQCAGWWLSQTPVIEGVMVSMCSDEALHGPDEEISEENSERVKVELLQTSQQEKPHKELRWARLFGSGIGTSGGTEKAPRNNNHQTQKTRLPSQWLKLGASKVDLLAQSVWGRDTGRTLCEAQPKQRQ